MIEINLLPEEMRKQKRDPLKLDLELGKVKVIAIAAVIGVLLLVILFPIIGTGVRKKQTMALIIKEQQLSVKKSDIEAVNKELSFLRAKQNALSAVTTRKFLWSKKLNELSDLIMPGIWYTLVRMDSENKLIIEGKVISKQEEAMAAVGKFMRGLQEDSSFFSDFSDIKLESVERENVEERDVVNFRIVLYL